MQHTCRYNSTGEDKIQQKAPTSSISILNTFDLGTEMVWEQRANFSTINYFNSCSFCSEGFLLPLCALDGLRYLLWHYHILWPSIYLFCIVTRSKKYPWVNARSTSSTSFLGVVPKQCKTSPQVQKLFLVQKHVIFG